MGRSRKKLLALCLVAACGGITTPGIVYPVGVAWTPPAAYRRGWAKAEKCTGVMGNYDAIKWRIMAGRDFRCKSSGRCFGEHVEHKISIAHDWAQGKNASWVVIHEMIHELGFEHDTLVFGHKCHAMEGYLVSDDPGYRP